MLIYHKQFGTFSIVTDIIIRSSKCNRQSVSDARLTVKSTCYESPEGSFEIRDSISEIRDSKFNILINQWV
jgi:hypothetical protein